MELNKHDTDKDVFFGQFSHGTTGLPVQPAEVPTDGGLGIVAFCRIRSVQLWNFSDTHRLAEEEG